MENKVSCGTVLLKDNFSLVSTGTLNFPQEILLKNHSSSSRSVNEITVLIHMK